MIKRLSSAILTAGLLLGTYSAVSTAWSKPPDLPLQIREICDQAATEGSPQVNNTIFSNNSALPQETQVPATQASKRQGITTLNYQEYAAMRYYQMGQECEQKGDLEMARNCYEEANRYCPQSKYGELAAGKMTALNVATGNNAASQGAFETEEEPPQIKQEIIREDRSEQRRMQESLQMLQMGDRYRHSGDLDNAFRCYQDANLLCPTCRYGQEALERLFEVEAIRSKQMQEQHQGGIEEQEPPVDRRRAPLTPDELNQRDQAHLLLLLGDRARRAGDLRDAYGLYQETHLAFPDSYYGMRAIERMHQIETRRQAPANGGDESQTPGPRQSRINDR
jgi:tetratricopeptide (TPR) repeat protein